MLVVMGRYPRNRTPDKEDAADQASPEIAEVLMAPWLASQPKNACKKMPPEFFSGKHLSWVVAEK